MRFNLAMLLLVLPLSPIYSQSRDSLAQQHDWGVLVAFDGTAFAGLGGRLCLDANTSLDLLAEFGTQDIRYPATETMSQFPPLDEQVTSIALKLSAQRSVLQLDDLALYVAAAIRGMYHKYSSENTIEHTFHSQITRSLRIYLGFGAEYALTKRLSLSAQTLAYWTRNHDTINQSGGTAQTVDRASFQAGESTILLTFYF